MPEPTVGSYEVVRKLARGGMAELFLARAPAHAGRLVVLKRILPKYVDSPRFVRLFADEARLAASLDHANIVQVYDIGDVGGDHYFTMEYLHGQDLRSILHRAWHTGGRVSLAHAVQVGRQIAAALHYAHEKRRPDGTLLDIVHRDVSPSNVIVTYNGQVKLLDFGVAKAATSTIKTRTGTLKGKIAYMSPEQARGAPIDRRSDIFSLGIVLWEMVTTQRLFRGDNDLATLQLVINQPPRRPSEVVPDCPPELERIVLRALAQDVDRRYQTAAELERELDQLVAALGLAQDSAGLARYVSGLFASELASWQLASAGGDLTMPVDDSEFAEAELDDELDDEDDDGDGDELDDGEAPATVAGTIVSRRAPTPADGSRQLAPWRDPTGPVPRLGAVRIEVAETLLRRDPTGAPRRDSSLRVEGSGAVVRRDPSGARTPSAGIAIAMHGAQRSATPAIGTPVPEPIGRSPSGPTATPRTAWPAQVAPSPEHTPASPFPAARGLIQDVPLLQDLAADRAAAAAHHDGVMTPEQIAILQRRFLYVAGGLVALVLVVAIIGGIAGGGARAAASITAPAPPAVQPALAPADATTPAVPVRPAAMPGPAPTVPSSDLAPR